MITVRNLAMISIAISFYLLGEAVAIPSLYVPFGLFVIGIFLGIVRKPYNYYLYFLSMIAAIPELITEYGKMLLTIDSEISAMIGGLLLVGQQTTSNTTIQATQPWWVPIGILTVFLLCACLVLDTVKALIKNARLYLIISSYPLLGITCNFLFMWIYITLTLPSLVGGLSGLMVTSTTLPEQLTNVIKPMYRNLIVGQRVIGDLFCMFLAPIYAYYVAKELKIYKRLGIDSSKPKIDKPKKQTSNDIVIEMLRSTIIKSADDREY